MNKNILLVSCNDYRYSGVNFKFIAAKRRLDLLDKNPSWRNDPNVIFTRMDVRDGEVAEIGSDPATNSWAVQSQTFTPISSRSQFYDGTKFREGPTTVMSVTDCYEYVINLGISQPGSLYEFSILGHAWEGGPILVNSYERAEYRPGGAQDAYRDPWDRDGRNIDFLPQNLDETKWINFRKAFSSDGYCWIWGCIFQRAYFNTLQKVMSTTSFRAKNWGSHTDSDTFTINVAAYFANNYYGVDPLFFPASKSELNFTRTLKDIKDFLKRGMRRSYAGRFAADNDISCRAAFLGTYADYERSHAGNRVNHSVMTIPRNRAVYGVDFTNYVKFCNVYLNLSEDPENRGYVIYDPAAVISWFKI